MSYFGRSYLCFFVVIYMTSDLLYSAELTLDRTLEKVAAAMLREHPELREGVRSSEARALLVKEFRSLEADRVSTAYLKKIKRQKVDYQFLDWIELLERFEKAKLTDPKCVYLLSRAKSQKMRSEEFYVVNRLIKSYYNSALEERENISKGRLRRVGKAFTSYLKSNKVEPRSIDVFVEELTDRLCMDPYTGGEKEWIFVASGKSEIRGANNHRVVAYSPFKSGRLGSMRWVGYKGGVVGEWKESTLTSAVVKMHAEISKRSQLKELAEIEKKKESKPIVVKKEPKQKKLAISIRELW